jgi:hypothetical protein
MLPHPLWGAIVDGVEIDLLRQRVEIYLRLITKETKPEGIHRKLEFEDISDVRWFTSILGPWSYAELTEIHVTRSPDGTVTTEIMLWSEDAGLSINAKSVRLDGVEMTPEG